MKTFLLVLIFTILVSLSQAQNTNNAPEIKIGESLTYAERQTWRSILNWPQSYEDSFLQRNGSNKSRDPDSYGGIHVYELEDSRYLVEIESSLAAYQGIYIYMIYNQQWEESSLLSFPYVMNDIDFKNHQISSQIEVGGLPIFDDVTKELEIYSRARGIGGCGSLNRYRFKYASAYLVDVRSQSCDEADAQGENMLIAPHDWPVIWPPQPKAFEK